MYLKEGLNPNVEYRWYLKQNSQTLFTGAKIKKNIDYLIFTYIQCFNNENLSLMQALLRRSLRDYWVLTPKWP